MSDDLEKRITAKYVLDSTGFNNSLKGINSQLANNKAQLNLASEGLKAYGASSEKIKGVQQALAQQLELHSKKIDVWKSSIEKTTVKMQENIKERERLKQSLQEAGQKHAEIVRQYGKESEEAQKSKSSLKALGEEYKNKGKQIESNAKQIEHYNMQQTKSQAELVKTQGALNKVNKELAESNNKWLSAGESLKKSSEGLKNAGAKISSVGDGILKATAPLVAFGIAGSKMSMDFGDSMAQISTISDDTQVPIDKLRKQILKLSNDSGIAVDGLSTSIYDALSAGQQTGDVMNFVEKNTRLAKGGFADIGSTIDLTTSILNAYKMKSEEVADVSDILIQVQNKGKTTVKQLSADMGKVIPTAVSTNTSLRQLGTAYALMTANGIKTAETTTYVNSLLNELSKTGTDADKALRQVAKKSFSDLMKDGKSLGDVLQILDEYAKKNKLSLKDMFGSAEAGKAALVLSTNAGEDFANMLKDMNNTAGMTDDAFNKVSNTSGEGFRRTLNRLKNEGIRLGDALAPLLEKGIDLVSKVTDKISGLSEEQLQNYAKWTMMAMGIGGFLKVAGGAVIGIGNVVGAVGTLSEVLGTATVATEVAGTAGAVAGGAGGLGALTGALGAIAPIALPAIAIIGGVGLAAYGIHKVLSKDVVPSIDLFEDKVQETSDGIYTETIKISEGTKKAVGAYIEMDKGATTALNNLYINSTAITEESKNTLISKYSEMSNAINTGLDTKRKENINNLTEFFGKSKAITDAEEAQILAKTDTYYANKKGVVEIYQNQIKQILENAKNDHRAITDEEAQTINDIQNRMKEQAIKALSDNEVEAQVILQRMKDYDGRVTAEMAAEHIKKLNESRDGAVKAANDEYEKNIATIIRMRDESKTISADQAEKLIADATRQRDEIINKAEDTRLGAIEKMRSMNTDLESQVDTSTGNILTTWDKIKRWWNGWKPEKKSFNYNVNGGGGGGKVTVMENWTGTSYFQGGLTTLHERGEEIYQLPRGTRIYNTERSEQMVLETAEQVAEKVAQNVLSSFQGMSNIPKEIIVPVYLDKREMARAVAPLVSQEISDQYDRFKLAGGLR